MAGVLVTGGAGFIGSNLVDALVKEGEKVTVLDDLSTGKKEYLNKDAEFWEMDICDPALGERISRGKFDLVFHLAAQIDVGKSVKDPEFDNRVNLIGSKRLFEAAARSGVKKIIFTSTGGALYGNCERPARENTLIQPTSPYAIHKYAAERYLELMKELYGTDYTVLRLANVYGPRQYKGGECGVIGIFTYNIVKQLPSKLFGDGTKTRDFVYIDDIVRAHLAAARSKYSGVFNIGSKQETNILSIVKAIEDAIGNSMDIEFLEDKPGEVRRSVLDNEKARELLDWEPHTGLKEGIGKTLKWLREG